MTLVRDERPLQRCVDGVPHPSEPSAFLRLHADVLEAGEIERLRPPLHAVSAAVHARRLRRGPWLSCRGCPKVGRCHPLSDYAAMRLMRE